RPNGRSHVGRTPSTLETVRNQTGGASDVNRIYLVDFPVAFRRRAKWFQRVADRVARKAAAVRREPTSSSAVAEGDGAARQGNDRSSEGLSDLVSEASRLQSLAPASELTY